MKAPNVIFVDDLAVVNDCATKISIHSLPNFSEYIRKDALMEWAKGEIMPGNSAEGKGWNRALQTLIDKLNSI